MNILVIDKFNARRDPAQMDMYKALAEKHTVFFAEEGRERPYSPFTDIIYLGIYHQILPVDYSWLFLNAECPVIIDQADNEDFIRRMPKMSYNSIKPPKAFLSRYLPHKDLQNLIPNVKQLSWYVNPTRVNYNGEPKDIDVAFVCSMYGKRHDYAQAVTSIYEKKGLKCFVGTVWGEDYYNILRRSKVFIAECSRKCYTQKYIEAALCGCVIVGDKPLSPINDIPMIEVDMLDLEKGIEEGLAHNMLYRLTTPAFADKDYFLKEFDAIINSL